MAFKVKTLRRAEADIARIYSWIADRSEQGAAHLYDVVRETIKLLVDDADHHGLASESTEIGMALRQRIFKTRRGQNYRLLYTIVGNEVPILRVRGPGQAPIRVRDIEDTNE